MKKVIALIALLAAMVVQAGSYRGFVYSSSGDIVLGEWTSQFTKAKNFSIDNDIPLVVFYVNDGCSHCEAVEDSLKGSSSFKTWRESGFGSGLAMVFVVNGVHGEATKADSWFGTFQGAYPFVGVYWKGHKVLTSTNKKWVSADGWNASKFMSTVEKWLKDYTPDKRGSFDLTNETEGHRYEVEDNAEDVTIDIPLSRAPAAAQFAATNVLVVTYPSGVAVTNDIPWSEGGKVETNKIVSVTIPAGTLTKDGDKVTLTLDEKEDEAIHVYYANPPVTSANPLWVDERIAAGENGLPPELKPGEWTMDLDCATKQAETYKGYTLVMVTGALWCPNCLNFESNFLTLTNEDGTVKFEKWAKDNNVFLVSMDVGKLNGGTNIWPTLLSREPAATSLKIYPSKVASGLGYLTRKNARQDDIDEVLARNVLLSRIYTGFGGMIRPEDTEDPSCNGYRPRVPCFVLLDSEGNCVTRMTRFSFPTTPVEADRKWYDNYLLRFEEMLAMAGKGETEHAYPEETENDYPGECSVELNSNGGEKAGELCCADLRDTFKLTDANNARISVSVEGDSTARVRVSLWQVGEDGEAKEVKGIHDAQQLSTGISLPAYTCGADGEYYVQVKAANIGPDVAYLDHEFSPTNPVPNNFIAYTVKSSVVLVPHEKAAENSAVPGSDTIKMDVEKGVLYRIEGLKKGVPQDSLEMVEDDLLFRATDTKTAVLTCAEKGGKVKYQKWTPGEVGFEPAYVTTPAKSKTPKDVTVTRKENEKIEVAFRRVTGVSGDVKVLVSLDKAATTFYYDYAWTGDENDKNDPRFSIDGDLNVNEWKKEVEWKDGTSLSDCVEEIMIAPAETGSGKVDTYFGDGTVVLKLAIVEQTAAGVQTNEIDNGTFTVNFLDNQKKSSGSAAIIGTDREIWSKAKTVYARENEAVKLDVARFSAFEGDVDAKLKPSVKTVTLAGDCADGIVHWNHHKDALKTVTVTNLPAAGKSVKVTLSAVTKGFKVLSSSNAVTIVSVAADAPSFAKERFPQVTAYRYVAFTNLYPVVGATDDGTLSFKKLSGSLPAGLSAKLGETEAGTPALMISGVPTGKVKAGTVYTAVYQVVDSRPKTPGSRTKVSVPGMTAEVSFKVIDPTYDGTGPSGEAPLNEQCAKSRTFKDLMVVTSNEVGAAELFGTLQLTLPPTGKASAKLSCASGTVSFSAKSWSQIDPVKGTLFCTLVGSKNYAGWTLDVEASAEDPGPIVVTFRIDGELVSETGHGGRFWSKDNHAKDCFGSYTVTFAVNKNAGDPDITGPGADYATQGSAYLALTMSSTSQGNGGTMKWAGALPNGKSVSGSSVLTDMEDGLHVCLPFVKQVNSSKDTFSGALMITRGAKDKDDKECWETVDVPKIDIGGEPVNVLSRWIHTEKSKYTDKGDFSVRFKPYGGIYDISKLNGLNCCCKKGRGTDKMLLEVVMPADFASDYYGEFLGVEPLTLTVGQSTITRDDKTGGANKISLTFTKSSGVVKGSFKLPYLDSYGNVKTLSASYEGVVQLGFGSDCGGGCETSLPFLSGAWRFTDKIEYQGGSKPKYISSVRGGVLKIDSIPE